MKLIIDDNNRWCYKKKSQKTNTIISDNLILYLNSLSEIFENAKKISEFEFILTLLRVRGLMGPGWDPYETTEEVFELISKEIYKVKNYKTHRHLSLWLYGHIIEASELYEILASLLIICNGGRFSVNNFPDRKKGKYISPISPTEKIDKIYSFAKKVNLEQNCFPLKDIYNRELRNAIFHSDYSLINGDLRLTKKRKIIKNDQFVEIINKGFAYFIAMSSLIKFYIGSYAEPKIIKVHPDFSSDPNETAITIIREGYGLIGIKDYQSSISNDEYVSYLAGRFSKSESELLNKNPNMVNFPKSKREIVNKILNIFPISIRKILVKFLNVKIKT